jgi:transcriptional regulator with XRE-family HTH domain
MATTLAPVDSREVVRCDHCHLVQFQTNNHLCRRCHTSLEDEPEPIVVETVPAVTNGNGNGHHNGNGNGNGHSQIHVAQSIRSLRHRFGLSQRQLALRMQVPRTYVSKIENEKATPTLSSLERLARALEVNVSDLVSGCTNHHSEIQELMQDEFIAELIPFVSKLNGMQCSSILAQVRDMTLRPRRTS